MSWRGLKGYWDSTLGCDLNELRDQVSGVDAAPTNMVAADWVPGPDGRVWDLPDGNDVLVTSDHSIYNDLAQFTWIIRVKVDTFTDHMMLVNRGDYGINCPFCMWLNNGVDSPQAIVNDGGGFENPMAATVIAPATWYDIAWTFMRDSQMRLFVNGIEDANSPFATPLITTLRNDGIGDSVVRFGERQSGDWPLDGQLGRIAFYNRVLTSNEIIDHWINPHLVTQLAI